MKRLLPSFLIAGALLAGELDPLLEKLEDPATRDAAARSLVERGTPALAELRKAAEKAALKAPIEAIVKEIEAKEPSGLLFRVGGPRMKLTLDHVNGDDLKLSINVTNRGTKTLVLWPYVSLRLLDAKGEAVGRNYHIGRWGRGRSKRWLENVKYAEIAPGGTWGFETPLKLYTHDDTWIEGWEVPEPGTYTIEVTYRFDRAQWKKTCDPAWEKLDDPGQPWNRALEMTHVFTAEMTVAEPR